MKVVIEKDGAIKIIAETIVEAWALNGVWPVGLDICECCNSTPHKLVIDCSILLDTKEGG